MSLNETHSLTAGATKFRFGDSVRPLILASAACGLLAGPFSLAADYQVQPSIKGRLTNDDNLLLNNDGLEIETLLFVVTPRLQVTRSTEKWQATVDASLTAERLEVDDFNSDNQNLTIQLIRQAETVQFQLVALNDRGNTRVNELDELGQVGVGVDRRDRQYIRPGATWTLNAKNRLAFGVSGENVHYGGLVFSDYDNFAADVAWTHQFDEKTQFNVSTFASEYTAAPPVARPNQFEVCDFTSIVVPGVGINFARLGSIDSFESETVGVQVGGSRQPTRRFSYRGSLGYRSVTNTNDVLCAANGLNVTSGSSDGFILDTGANYQGEKYGVDVSFARSITPVGLGFLTERDNFRLNMSYRFTEHLTATFLVNGFNTQSIDEGFAFEQEGFRVAPGMNWRFNEKLSLNGGVIYRSAESLFVEGERDGLSVYVGFNYNFKPVRFTR
ncbi:MAG: hypothetical protein AB8G18_17110 [Gammaproteobacteria bacterium]